MQLRFSGGVLFAATLLGAVAACAPERGDGRGAVRSPEVDHGEWIAEVLCSNCHLVALDRPESASDAVPTFRSIARAPSTSAGSLAAFLANPHGKMPDLVLNRKEIHDVSAYILSLGTSP